MTVFLDCVKQIYRAEQEQSTVLADDTFMTSGTPLKPPFNFNSLFTMPALMQMIEEHDGNFLLMFDEISVLFKVYYNLVSLFTWDSPIFV